MKKITIVGGGWLGKPLGQYLTSIGHSVHVSKTTPEGVKELEQLGINSFVANLANGSNDLDQQLSSTPTDIVIGCFPPGFRKQSGQDYVGNWQTLIASAQNNGVQRVVMVSSTTVYPNLAQEMVEEDATLDKSIDNPEFSDNAKIMLQAEQHLIDSRLSYAIVRCSGLVGPNRHPSRFAAMLKQVSDQAPANMLHLHDAVGVVSFMALNSIDATVNATTPNTVNKAEYYQAALDSVASDNKLPTLVHVPDKRIIADKLISLGYRFHFQHTLDAL